VHFFLFTLWDFAVIARVEGNNPLLRVVKRPSFSTFILKSSLVYVEGGLHAEFEVWEYSDTAYAMENAHRVKHQTLWKGGQQWKYF